MSLAPSTRVGPYEVIAPLGAGGMGEVYRARDVRLGRDVALKILPEHLTTHPESLARFEREARAVAALNHPNIVTLYGVEESDGVRVLVMELVEGRRLDEHLVPGGLPVARVLEIGIALADALTAAHERGVVHRDLKPANVMLTRDDRVKVLDFGLAKLQPAAGETDSGEGDTTQTMLRSMEGRVMGTAPYMAPEQVRGEAADSRTDVFALGVLLYEVSSGQRPFAGINLAELGAAILRDAPAALGELRPELPDDLVRILDRCLEKSPRVRFQTALDVANELRALRRTLEKSGTRPIARSGTTEAVASIAVLPFVNRSPNPQEDEYFSDGLADELINVLAKIRGLRVAARTSTNHFKGSDKTLAEIGRVLGVETVLEGSVRKAGNRVRVSVQLVRIDTGDHLWSESYDRTLEDIFAVQDDIARSVVKELRAALLGQDADSQASGEVHAEVAQATKERTSDPEAHRLHLQAKYFINRAGPGDMEKAVELIEKALAIDPEFALGWVELARARTNQLTSGIAASAKQAREAVERALALDPALAEAWSQLAWIQRYDWNWRGARESMARAFELEPGNIMVQRRAGVLAATFGHFEEAVDLLRRAVDQDPLNLWAYQNLALTLYAAERFDEAEEIMRRGLELSPQMELGHRVIARIHLARGRAAEALEVSENLDDQSLRLEVRAVAEHKLGHAEKAEAALRELIENHSEDSAFQIAEVYGMRGEADLAFEWLERAYTQRDPGVADLQGATCLPIRSDPRWLAFLRKIGVAD